LDKPREIDSKAGSIRLASRESYDMRKAAAIPSATGGRPSTSAPVAGATGEQISQVPQVPSNAPAALDDINTLVQNGRLRMAQRPQGFLPGIPRLNRSIAEYTINNDDLVNVTSSYLDKLAQDDPSILDGFTDSYDMAQNTVALISRYFEPGEAPPLVSTIHQSRAGREAYNYLRQISEAYDAEY
jgi:hypothetical protein